MKVVQDIQNTLQNFDISKLFFVEAETFSTQPTVLFSIGDIKISSSIMTGWLMIIFFLFVAIYISRKIKFNAKPTKVQSAVEIFYSFILDLVEGVTANRQIVRKILPIVLSVMLYVGISNIFTLIPFVGAITFNDNALFTTSTRDWNTTLGIALVVALWTQYASVSKFKLTGHAGKYIKVGTVISEFKKGIGKGFMSLIDLFIGLLDIISEFAKPTSLSVRLFGNVVAGEVLASLIMSFFAIGVPILLMLYSVFTGLLQALVFGALTASYFVGSLDDSES